MESPFMVAVFTAATLCLIAPYLASIFNSDRAIHCLSHAWQGEEQSKKGMFSLSSSPPPPPPPPLHTSIESSVRVFVWEKEEAVFGFGSGAVADCRAQLAG